MNISKLQTPAILIRSQAMQHNLTRYQQACDQHHKQLWPMLKTHKSTAIADMQQALGASGFLCGTLDECEALCSHGVRQIMYAYPLAGEIACRRAAALAKACDFYARIDTLDSAAQLNAAAQEMGIIIRYTIILDCGLHRFGMDADAILPFAQSMKRFANLEFMGISTHCGHVYAEADAQRIPLYAQQERESIHSAVSALRNGGFNVRMVTSGATPTFFGTVDDEIITHYHPGNYVFQDRIQMANHTASEDDCALVIYANVISHPREGLLICDAGAKCLGLDQGAHGNSALRGHGHVIGHPELLVTSLSEEVGKISISGATDVKVGDRIMIIPNHACSSANLTDYYIAIDICENAEKVIRVDIRSNATTKGISFEI